MICTSAEYYLCPFIHDLYVMDDKHDVYAASYCVQLIFGYIMLGVAYYLLQLFVSYFGYIIDDVACNNLHHFYLKLLAAGIG